jgi:hypothetical protein
LARRRFAPEPEAAGRAASRGLAGGAIPPDAARAPPHLRLGSSRSPRGRRLRSRPDGDGDGRRTHEGAALRQERAGPLDLAQGALGAASGPDADTDNLSAVIAC